MLYVHRLCLHDSPWLIGSLMNNAVWSQTLPVRLTMADQVHHLHNGAETGAWWPKRLHVRQFFWPLPSRQSWPRSVALSPTVSHKKQNLWLLDQVHGGGNPLTWRVVQGKWRWQGYGLCCFLCGIVWNWCWTMVGVESRSSKTSKVAICKSMKLRK